MRFVIAALCLMCVSPGLLRAGEIRISTTELVTLTRAVVAEASLRIHNKPDAGKHSHFTVMGIERTFSIPPTVVHDDSVTYFVTDLNSRAIDVRASTDSVELTIIFEDMGPELSPHSSAYPYIQWSKPVISLSASLSERDNSISLRVTKIKVSDGFAPDCISDDKNNSLSQAKEWILNTGQCKLATILPSVKNEITKLPAVIEQKVQEAFNGRHIQDKISGYFREKLQFADRADIKILEVSTRAGIATIKFCVDTADTDHSCATAVAAHKAKKVAERTKHRRGIQVSRN